MRIDVQVDNSSLLLRLRHGEKRLAFATVNAINATAKRIQLAEFEHVRQAFTIRKPTFFFGTPTQPGGVAARLFKASVGKDRPYAEVFVGRASSVASQRRLLLPQFERGGTKKGFRGGNVSVPITGGPARPAFSSSIPKEWTFAGMAFKAWRGSGKVTYERRNGNGRSRKVQLGLFDEFGRAKLGFARSASEGGIQWRGRNRTFLLARSRGLPLGGVFQRTGPKRGDIRLVYKIQESVGLRQMMQWVRTGVDVSRVWFKEEMEKETIKALKFARGPGL